MMIGGGGRVCGGARRGISGRVAAASVCTLLNNDNTFFYERFEGRVVVGDASGKVTVTVGP
jgi:hypothetical protein